MSTLETFEQFLKDKDAWDMYISGNAGTGKTTNTSTLVKYCQDHNIPYAVCAFTHKACGVLRAKLPEGATIKTLSSFLGKSPMMNTDAVKVEHVSNNIKRGATDAVDVLFIDEYSMVGEKDGLDIAAAQDPDYEGAPLMKVVWIGDTKQLGPVGDKKYTNAYGDYQVELKKNYRNDNPLQGPLNELISFIDGEAQPKALEEVEGYFYRVDDLVQAYLQSPCDDKVMLAFTNKRVQELNAAVGDVLDVGSEVFSPTSNHQYIFMGYTAAPSSITRFYDFDECHLGSKYKTLEHLLKHDLCDFAHLRDEEGNEICFAVMFGHYDYKVKRDELMAAAVEANAVIEEKYPKFKAAGWAKANPKHKLARQRAKAWRDCLCFNEYVICIDFPHATTVHKSQGSTYMEIYLDMDDLAICAEKNFEMYLRLNYVGMSRASHKVIGTL